MKNRINQLRLRIQQAAISCGRDPASIRLIAASKSASTEMIRTAIFSGLNIFGENYIQEAVKKIETLSEFPIKWHFIGHLQSNKAKYAVRYFDLIHTVDSLKLAEAINQQAEKINKIQGILIQVNIAGEQTKSGVSVKEAASLVKKVSVLSHVSIMGLMTIPPYFNSPQKVGPFFKALADLMKHINNESILNLNMNELSMGMTGDFETAICEGATLLRIGTAIFGERK